MALSSPNRRLVFDEVRSSWVVASKEEIVRQNLLQKMVKVLGYPKHLIGVEKSLSEMPHLQEIKTALPSRRVDVTCFMKGAKHFLVPLLAIECKHLCPGMPAFEQILGYNHYLQAPFIGIAAEDTFFLQGVQKGKEKMFSELPPYETLLQYVKDDNFTPSS